MNHERALPTSDEVDRRLRLVSELRNLCLSLGRARPVTEPDFSGSRTSASPEAGENQGGTPRGLSPC